MRAAILAAALALCAACSNNAAPDAADGGSDIADRSQDIVAPTDVQSPADVVDTQDASPDVPLESAPRPIAPLATSTVTSQRPTFHFVLSADADQPQVEICSARACDTIEQTFGASGTSGRPMQALAPGVHYWRIHDGTRTTATWPFYVRHRDAAVDVSYGTVPDVNGDGFADVLAGANHADGQLGHVQVFHGGPSGIGATPQLQLQGIDPNGHFGWSVASAGDVNGDGFGDVIVGAADAAGLDGRAYVFMGSSNGLASMPAAMFVPTDAMGNFGTVVSSIGDVNGDGYADVAVGVPNANVTAGRVYVYYGSHDGLRTTAARVLDAPGGVGGEFGYSLGGAGDVNGDGFADMIVGANSAGMSYGEVYLYFGGFSGIGAMPTVTISSPADVNGEFGAFVDGAGDVNGDGYSDVIAGATATTNGNAYVYYGGAGGVPAAPNASMEGPDGLMGGFGWSVSTAGDVNGDGFDDVVVGATCAMFGADPDGGYPHCGNGRAYVYMGSIGGVATTPGTMLQGPQLEDAFGWSLGGAGDVDGDGYGDLFVSAYAIDMFAGAAYLFHGGMSGLATTPWATMRGGTGSSDNYGWSVALAPRAYLRPSG